MLKFLLFLILQCTYDAFASVPENAKQQKRGIVDNNGWIGLSNPYGYGYGHPWAVDRTPWRGLKLSDVNLHAGLHLAGAIPYGRGGIALTSGVLKTLPVYITKHVVLEKPVPVPEPVIIEKPYHVPVEKLIPVPIEKIIHRPIPVPVPVPQAVPIPVGHPIPIPVKQPIPIPIQQPYPVPVKHPVPIPVPIPIPIHSPPPIPLISANGLAGAIYARNYAPGHFFMQPPVHLGHGIATLDHGFSHGFAHGYGHNYGYVHDAADAYVRHAHGHEHKKRKADKN